MDRSSKVISKTDESSKKFIMKCLDGNVTHGFDIDSIYFSGNKWFVLEFLKCDSKYMSPHTSDPRRYPWNWKKFHSLYQISKLLKGELILVNYSDREKDSDQVKVMYVKELDYKLLQSKMDSNGNVPRTYLDYIVFSKVDKISFEEFQHFLVKLNFDAEISTFK